jgi:hypothetical protein
MAEKCLELGGNFDLEKLFSEVELNRIEKRLCEALSACAFNDTEASVETKTLALLYRKWGAPHILYYGECYEMVSDLLRISNISPLRSIRNETLTIFQYYHPCE